MNKFQALILTLTMILLFSAPSQAGMPPQAKIIDGNTFEIKGKTYVLHGVDAPEIDQTCKSRKNEVKNCGKMAARALYFLLRNSEIICENEVPLENGFIQATCKVGWINVSEQMVLDGWAMAIPGPDGEPYRRFQQAAKARKEGLWKGGSFDMPWDWRAKNGQQAR